jgi:RNA polymerase sigma factor (sigma-70 family)
LFVLDDVDTYLEVGAEVVSSDRHASGGKLGYLYEIHSPAGLRLAFVLTGERASAEDLFQEAFLKASGHLAGMRDEAAFGAYLRRSIVNLHTSHLRRRKVEREHLQRIATKTSTQVPESDVALREDMWQLLLGLPARQRAVVYLRLYEDHSEAETAEILNCSRRAVRSLLHRAVSALRIDYRGDET